MTHTESLWVRRLWPHEGSTLGWPTAAEAESRATSHDVESVASRIRVPTTKWVAPRWPCWPPSWLQLWTDV